MLLRLELSKERLKRQGFFWLTWAARLTWWAFGIPVVVVVVVVVVKNFKHLRKRLAYRSQISCGASFRRGNKSLLKWSRSHDQNDCHARNSQNLKKSPSPEQLGQLHWNLVCSIKVCSTSKFNRDPLYCKISIFFFWSPRHLNTEKLFFFSFFCCNCILKLWNEVKPVTYEC